MRNLRLVLVTLSVMLLTPAISLATGGHHPSLPADLPLYWIIPFVCMLLSIAIGPLAAPHFWEHHYGKISLFWAFAFLIPATIVYGFPVISFLAMDTILLEYLPFILLLLALFTAAGGIRLTGSLAGTPLVNTGILLFGTLIASWVGTTGAAIFLIRPILKANKHRKYRVHQVIFFIFLVANIGGALTPLGDPPLFLGFLKGVEFFWTTTNLLMPTIFASVTLLALYFALDTFLYRKEGCPVSEEKSDEKLGLDGSINILYVAMVVGLVLLSGSWKPGITYDIYGVPMTLESLVRNAGLLGVAALSWFTTSKQCRKLNDFTWEPILEVGKLFIGIFLSMIPALAILRAGADGSLASLVLLVSDASGEPNNVAYFWLTGILSAFLDNAPTYLVFFNTAGGDATQLMTTGAGTLIAISLGAVFMGAVTYIGNAPNFMVRSIASTYGVKMPSFFGYMVWSVGILFPLFALITFLFIM